MKLGIDLGTTNTLAAYINDHNMPELIPDPRFNNVFITPSVVHVGSTMCVVGEALERIIKANKHLDVTRNAKLAMGSDQTLFTNAGDDPWTPEKIAALILRKIKHDAETKLGQPVGSALIAIPANFNSAERLSTQVAALMAGFVEVDLVEEPVSAAASYCFNAGVQEQTLFVYDLGGGTFDATVIHLSDQGLYALSTIGSKTIGGKTLDDRIGEEVKALCSETLGRSRFSVGAEEVIHQFALHAKSTLHRSDNPLVRKSVLIDGGVMDICFGYQHLSKVLYPLLDETLRLSDQCVREAGLNWRQIDTVLLVGGSSKLPAVREKLAALTGKSEAAIKLYQPHEAIAYGAAILGNEITGNNLFLKQQIASFNLGVGVLNPETGKMQMETLIQRNAPLPKTVTRTFYTNRRQQDTLTVQLLISKEESAAFDLLGNFSFGPIENTQEHEPVEIEITYNRNGIVNCAASTASQQVVNVQNISNDVGATSLSETELPELKCY